MNKDLIAYEETGFFSDLMKDYLSGKEELQSFYGNPFSLDGFKKQLSEKQCDPQTRAVLVRSLMNQYGGVELSTAVQNNLAALEKENTYTITTGHQLNLFTGPLYFIYKIVSAINLAKRLKQEFPDKNFVPVYWMATEDHDFEEISFFNLLGKRHEIKKHAEGPVGRMKLGGIEAVFSQLEKTLENRTGLEDVVALFKQFYTKENTFTQAVRGLVNELFGKHGLVIIDGDDSGLKTLFSPMMENELLERSSEQYINSTSEKLEALGYKKQVNPRAINLFYIQDGLRERIIFEDNQYKVLNSQMSFSEDQLLEELTNAPEKFSPNAALRPLYQEVILPNLAYIGGGGELAYWLQLKAMFQAYDVPFPILMLRNSALLLDGGSKKKMDKLEMSVPDLFKDEHELIKQYVKESAEVNLELLVEQKSIAEVFASIEKKSLEIDASLKGMVNAELQKTVNAIQNIEKRLIKASKQKEEVAINQIAGLKAKLFPNGSLQERVDNYLFGYMLFGTAFIDLLLENLEPFDQQFAVLQR